MLKYRQYASRAWSTLRQRTPALLAALGVLALLASTAGPWQRRGVSCDCETDSQALQPLEAVQGDAAEPEGAPDDATFAICTMVKLEKDDPQWNDGRAEDLHEVRLCAAGSTLIGSASWSRLLAPHATA